MLAELAAFREQDLATVNAAWGGAEQVGGAAEEHGQEAGWLTENEPEDTWKPREDEEEVEPSLDLEAEEREVFGSPPPPSPAEESPAEELRGVLVPSPKRRRRAGRDSVHTESFGSSPPKRPRRARAGSTSPLEPAVTRSRSAAAVAVNLD